ncbi:DNA repair protein rad2 [Apophysomyces ossiformis]|uniref:DNA repair protein rad2 n=1 Tax=Apophysomyces ossiformis TaxID=679940 RepID=A0A8H7BXG5_9FUNG|nr:DNA repair protein rad2 [Apophysomyces ossiformis]
MGVQGLWTLVGPAARPVQLESLRNRKLAVDASIWIHQFMRTMRDKEGNALRNGHLLGFFRRLCKLLFYNIKPVFVFDGGAPALKRLTIVGFVPAYYTRERRRRREGVVNNLKRTAEKILSAQAKSRFLLEEEKKRKGSNADEEAYVYFDELERSAAVEELRRRRKRDQFELPPTDQQMLPNKMDPRLATEEELQSFIDEFAPSEMDIDSDTFRNLPREIQYEIIQDLKIKSRQTSWARLEEMVRQSNTALDFSKQQIKQLVHRNNMTQKYLEMSSANNDESVTVPARIAGERSRQYILLKNESLDQGLGWRLPGISDSNKESPDIPKSPRSPTSSEEPRDKVQDAIAANPKLAAMMAELSDSDESERNGSMDGFEETNLLEDQLVNSDRGVTEEDEDEPLFIGQQSLIDDMGAYADEDAVNDIIARIYSGESQQPVRSPSPQRQDEICLNADEFFQLWRAQVPDAFIYMHSFNEEHKKLLHDAVYSDSIEKLVHNLATVQKVYGKTNDNDRLALESLSFQERFLKSTLDWKRELSSMTETLEGNGTMMLHDTDDEEESIRFQFADENTTAQSMDQKPSATSDHSSSLPSIALAQQSEIKLNGTPAIEKEIRINLATDDNSAVNESNDMNQRCPDNLVELLSKEGEIEEKLESRFDRNPTPAELSSSTTTNESNSDKLSQTVVEQSIGVEATAALLDSIEHQGYNSDEELVGDPVAEENEYARFVSDIASKDLESVRQDLYRDMKELNKQQRKEMGNTDDVTQQMVQDIQELLRLFGIPYVVSPMEAEAQCAELLQLSLVEGIVTDDSDVFLFGGSRVYKNMFNQRKYVECYVAQDIEREMRLNQGKLVQLAYLLGSDYTEGIPGIGPVAAMEILAEFSKPEDSQLQDPLIAFRTWYESGLDHTDFQRKFRKKHKYLEIPEGFPNPLVRDAYYHPIVDSSSQPFEWAAPQLDSLRVFLMESFTWSEKQADEVLIPVIRELNKRTTVGTQANISSYFDASAGASTYAPHKRRKHASKRVQSIVNRWRKGEEEDTESDSGNNHAKNSRKRTRSHK